MGKMKELSMMIQSGEAEDFIQATIEAEASSKTTFMYYGRVYETEKAINICQVLNSYISKQHVIPTQNE